METHALKARVGIETEWTASEYRARFAFDGPAAEETPR